MNLGKLNPCTATVQVSVDILIDQIIRLDLNVRNNYRRLSLEKGQYPQSNFDRSPLVFFWFSINPKLVYYRP